MNIQKYKADISVRRVGTITAPKLPPDHPSVRHSSCIQREVFPAADITEARQRAIARVENPNTPEFLKCLDFYYVPFKILQWENWQEPREENRSGRWKAKHPRFSKSIPAKANPFSSAFSSGLSKSLSTKLTLTADSHFFSKCIVYVL